MGPDMPFCLFPFPSTVCVLEQVKYLESEKGQSLHQQKLLSPTEITGPERPRQQPPPLIP